MVVQGWQTSISPVSAKTLRAVNVMTARDLARIQKDGGGGGPRFVYTFKNNAYH